VLPTLPTFWLWPENVPIWNAWHALQTQWRVHAMDGTRLGLDYASVTAWLQAQGWRHGRRRSLRHALACLGAMESAVLPIWRDQAERQAQRQRPPAH